MEKLGNIFYKDINRQIKAAITVEDEKNIVQELEEYVVTEEMEKHFKLFFNNYKNGIENRSHNIGVWISGFFGSGKSHFLKMLSYMIDNKKVNGKNVITYFKDKFRDKTLLEDIAEVQKMDTDVMLFNIASQASNNSITGNKDAILQVFEKVFNEKLGLSTTPAVAEIERNIIKNNKYEEFKKEFKRINGASWEEERNGFQFIEDDFAKAYSIVMNVTEEDARALMDKTERNYSLSIKEFANRVKEYIESKGNNHQVVFFVDEVSLYIGNDDKLVLDLQTMVEDLGDICEGRAWVIATAQQAIDEVIKNVNSLTLSKMLGRFYTRISISSTNIDEIIKERLLKKKENVEESLEELYNEKHTIIKNLLTFYNGQYQKEYENNIDFAKTYPLIPYQFPLLQDIFESIRDHGFAGISLAGSERTLISAVQEAVKACSECELGTLVPLYVFYDTAERELNLKVRNVIKNAEDIVKAEKLEDFDIKVLKTLFLLKNIKTIPSNIDNITTLFVSNIDNDKVEIREKIIDSLKRLDRQTLIQKKGNIYTLLTDDEQEKNRAIKTKVIDQKEITDYLKDIILNDLYNDTRILYRNRPFYITKAIDDYIYTNDYEIGFKIRTVSKDEEDKTLYFEDSKFAVIKLVLTDEIKSEMENKLRIEKYIREQKQNTVSDQLSIIISTKQLEMRNAESSVKEYVKNELETADIIINGFKQDDIKSRDIKTRINEALITVINNKYTKFNFIEKNYSKEDIKELFNDKKLQTKIAGMENFPNFKAYEELIEYIKNKSYDIVALSIRTVLQDFGKVPYGYAEDDILYLITKALKNGVINLFYATEIQSPTSDDTLNKIINRAYYDKTTIKLRVKTDQKLIDGLKSISRKYFNKADLNDDEDLMIEEFKKDCLEKQMNLINNNIRNRGYYNIYQTYEYPGKEEIELIYNTLKKLNNINYTQEFYEEVNKKVDFFEKYIPKLDKILEFFDENGKQKKFFDVARRVLDNYDKNVEYIGNNEEIEEIAKSMKKIMKSNEPFSEIFQLPILSEKLKNLLVNMYEEKCEPIKIKAKEAIEYFKKEVKDSIVDNAFAEQYIQKENAIINKLDNSNELVLIFAQETQIKNIVSEFDIEIENEKAKILQEQNKKEEEEKEEVVSPRKVIRVGQLINRSYEINNEKDIDNYISELREKLIEKWKKNKKFTIKEG